MSGEYLAISITLVLLNPVMLKHIRLITTIQQLPYQLEASTNISGSYHIFLVAITIWDRKPICKATKFCGSKSASP